jgi:4-amino-4-deoxy-L-arabinose transferase-like glycosyltransferase
MTTENLKLDAHPGSRAQDLGSRIIGAWTSLASWRYVLFLIISVWALVSVPPAIFHGYHYVEGLTVTIAQSALADGNWITPHLYNMRWIERPTLLPSIIAALSLPFGHVTPFLARLPIILSLLAGVLLIWRLLRTVASKEAALFGAALFLACPIVMRYYVTSVADIPLAVILFAAFLFWWRAYAQGRITIGSWVGIGCVLAVAALMKGPQPVAYFALGIFAFVVLTSTWWQLPGLMLAGIVAALPVALWYLYVFVPGDQSEWLRYTRLASSGIAWPHPFANGLDFFFETFPAATLTAILLLTGTRSAPVPRHFILALSCYAFACTFVVLFWPAEVNPRYILPMVPPLCVLGGVAYDALARRMPGLIAAGVSVVCLLLGYAAAHSVSDVLFSPAYIRSKLVGQQMAALLHDKPGPLYRTDWSEGLNELSYVPLRFTTIAPEAVPGMVRPSWLFVPAAEAPALIAEEHGRAKSVLPVGPAVLLRLE